MNRPIAPACERNKDPILEVMKDYITTGDRRLLEIGSGTGQHAVYMAQAFPWLEWYPTDTSDKLSGIKLWLAEANLKNIVTPTRLEIGKDEFPKLKFDVVFTANTFHILHWKDCKTLMKMMGNRLREGSRVLIYGPFKYNGEFTSESNAVFDESLKQDDPQKGIRSFEDVNNAMIKNGFELLADVDMPANNRTLVYNRLKFTQRR